MSYKQLRARLGHALLVSVVTMSGFETYGAVPSVQLGSDIGFQGGIVFNCPREDLTLIASSIVGYLWQLGIGPELYRQTLDEDNAALQFLLRDRFGGTDTLGLIHRIELDLKEELVQLPTPGKRPRTVVTVSQKEILLALLQSGRVTRFTGKACTVDALKDQVGIRQNTVAWSESVEFAWPNGKSARWNSKYWSHGNLRAHRALHVAIDDAFMHNQKYAIGCYTATKLIIIQGTLDYYRRIKNDPATADAIEARLMQDGEPLSHIEPGAAWYFEKDVGPDDIFEAGKLVYLMHGIAADNFVPGDWSYFLNTDPVTYEKTGYEGSNAIYLGRGKFDDYYNDSNHSYTYKEKLQEVYQWRYKVFSRERDVAKIHPLTAAELRRLGDTPENGGIELDYRLTPYAFGYVDLPAVRTTLEHP